MPRIKSEIVYEQFAQLADKYDLLKTAASDLEKYKDDPEARMGSDDISTIEALYGVKPNTSEEMEYADNIMQDAHPSSVIIAPSYDKINGLVENNIERSQIMQNIALKPPTGNHTNPKYAHQELLFELVKVANEMDARNQAELYQLADNCLIELHKQAGIWDDIKKWFGPDASGVGEGVMAGAGIGAALGALITVWTGPGVLAGAQIGALTGAAAGGALNAFTKTAPQVKNVEENAKQLLDELADLEKKVPEQQQEFELIKKDVHDIVVSANAYSTMMSDLKMTNTPTIGPPKLPISIEQIKKIGKDLVENIAEIKKVHKDFDILAASGAFAKAQPSSILKPIYWFIKDDIEDVSLAFVSLEEAIDKLTNASESAVNTAAQHIENTDPQAKTPSTSISGNKYVKILTDLLEHPPT